MYNVEDIRTPRDRINEEMLRRLLEDEQASCACGNTRVSQTRSESGSCMHGCERVSDGMPLAMVYSPCQIWRGIYDCETALRRGTLFKELDKPWGVERRNSCASNTVKGGCGCGK